MCPCPLAWCSCCTGGSGRISYAVSVGRTYIKDTARCSACQVVSSSAKTGTHNFLVLHG
ncbi:hypothetical protein M440DRAFT_1396069 [Trichoderma longibrachiatum ATCC 18648]|uniref:Uncharacterized protein n=1 Tax=Trichoderma longibrachiatum ATCC 18648 TaxID=983965 RepID=A0A2T4CH99_TRILO|nr:hypothetical protein M440DRAFT_1396069 [Trichoderma longibrachiatum ATCC 18648]